MCECTCNSNKKWVARQVAEHLTGEWKVSEESAFEGDPANLMGPDGLKLWLNIDRFASERKHARVRIGGVFGPERECLPEGVQVDEFVITVRADRGCEVIARETEARLIPRYREVLTVATEAHQKRIAAKEAVVSTLQEILGADQRSLYDAMARFGKRSKGVFKVFHADDVLISVRVPGDEAVAIARDLKQAKSLWL